MRTVKDQHILDNLRSDIESYFGLRDGIYVEDITIDDGNSIDITVDRSMTVSDLNEFSLDLSACLSGDNVQLQEYDHTSYDNVITLTFSE